MLGRVPIGALIPWWVVTIIFISIFFAIIAPKVSKQKNYFFHILYIFKYFNNYNFRIII